MAYILHDNLKSVDVKYGKPIKTPTKIYIPLFTKKSKSATDLKHIMISSSKMSIPWPKSYSNDETTFNIEFCNNDSNFVDELDTSLNHISTNCNASTNKSICHSQLKIYPNQAKSLRFFNVKTRDVSVYNEYGVQIPLETVAKDDSVKILFHVYAVYYREKEQQIGIELKLLQIMQLSPNKHINTQTHLMDKSCIIPPPPPPHIKLRPEKTPKSSMDIKRPGACEISLNDLIAAKSKLKKHTQ